MKPPKKKGDVSEAYFIAKCLERDWIVAKVVGDCERYDCVIDRGQGLERVQIKTGRINNGRIVFSCCSSTYHVPEGCSTKHARFSYKGQIDVFGVYTPEIGKSYIVPVDEVGIREASLRLDPSKNGQVKGIRMASSFEI